MLQSWRRKIREAQVALDHGQLEQAGELLRRDELQQFLPGQKLAEKLAGAIVNRAADRAAQGDTAAGWRDLADAERWGPGDARVPEIRRQLVSRGLQEAEQFVRADDLDQAVATLDRLARREVDQKPVRVLRQVVLHLADAKSAACRGRFVEAEQCVARAQSLRPDLNWLAARREDCRLKQWECHKRTAELHRALAEKQWPATLAAAEAVLALAPNHDEARRARRHAWIEVGLTSERQQAREKQRLQPTEVTDQPQKAPAVAKRQPGKRLMLWIDAVGGYLLCLGKEYVLGTPAEGGGADVPLLADLSRRHAVIHREAEGYVLEPVRETKIDGRTIRGPTSLEDGNLIELGRGVELRFRLPHTLSSTARLDLVSRHRLDLPADAVILMSESCVLGPGWHSHVVCPRWEQDLVFYRRGEELFCRTATQVAVDGEKKEGKFPVAAGTRIEGEAWALSFEAV